jgi:hypothetical protein
MTGSQALALRQEGRMGLYLAQIRRYPMLDERLE